MFIPSLRLCGALKTNEILPNIAGILVSDVLLLAILLVGLLRKQEARFGIARFLYRQVRYAIGNIPKEPLIQALRMT